MFSGSQAHIERVLHDHFLFRRLTDSQCHVLLDCMQRVEVKPGDVVVQQVISCLFHGNLILTNENFPFSELGLTYSKF